MDQKKIIITVDEKLAEVRIDKAISSILKEFSRMNIKQWINSGNILATPDTAFPFLSSPALNISSNERQF